MSSRLFPGLAVVAITAVGGASARAQWSVVVLHPEGARWSECRAVSPSVQVGVARFSLPNFMNPPVLWTGSSSSWINLAPQSSDSGEVYAMAGNQQAGELNLMAAVWSGTAATHVNLNPFWARGSYAYATDGTTQAGSAYLTNGNAEHATLWQGTAASAVDLHPPGPQYAYSGARAMYGDAKGGFVQYSDPNIFQHAALWRGSAGTFTDLNPGPGYASKILGMSGGIQVGYTALFSQAPHAAIWHGTAAGIVDLGSGELYATTGTIHAGTFFGAGGLTQGGIWLGSTPQDFLSLHQFLPPVYNSFSVATSVFEADGRIYVGGYAYGDGQNAEAVVGVRTVPRTCRAAVRPLGSGRSTAPTLTHGSASARRASDQNSGRTLRFGAIAPKTVARQTSGDAAQRFGQRNDQSHLSDQILTSPLDMPKTNRTLTVSCPLPPSHPSPPRNPRS